MSYLKTTGGWVEIVGEVAPRAGFYFSLMDDGGLRMGRLMPGMPLRAPHA